MNSIRNILGLCLTFAMLTTIARAQESDYEVKSSFEERYRELKTRIHAAGIATELEVVDGDISTLEMQYITRQQFLDWALYPQSFTELIDELRLWSVVTHDKLVAFEKIGFLTARIDSLSDDRSKLLTELKSSSKSVSALNQTIRQMSANIQANERLLFALIDTIFLPYGKDLSQVGELRKGALSGKLQKAGVASRIYDIASDNVRFLKETNLRGSDYASLIDHYHQFNQKWGGLNERISEVYTTKDRAGRQGKSTRRQTGKAAKAPSPVEAVDSVLAQWQGMLTQTFWRDLANEFSREGVTVKPFSDAESFAGSIREHVQLAKANEQEASKFANDVWRDHIDKEWRDALTKETMLGMDGYTSLDVLVKELGPRRFDPMFVVYGLLAVVTVGAGWWFVRRNMRTQAPGAAA